MSEGNGCLLLVLFAVGLILSIFAWRAFVGPVLDMLWSLRWQSAECEITEVSLIFDNEDLLAVPRYRFIAAGETFTGDRYSFAGQPSVDGNAIPPDFEYAKGTTHTCHFNPSDPTQSVLYRGFTLGTWLGLIPVVLLCLVGRGIVPVHKAWQVEKDPNTAPPPPDSPKWVVSKATVATDEKEVSDEPTQLVHDKLTKWWTWAIAATVMGCCVIFVFRLVVLGNWRWADNEVAWLAILGFVPVLLGALYFGMRSLNPIVELTLDHGTLVPGRSSMLHWQVPESSDWLRKLNITLVGTERATDGIGSSAETWKKPFMEIELVDTRATDVTNGMIPIELPGNAMHTFDRENNEINWAFIVRGEIKFWPDLKLRFPVVVRPRRYRFDDPPDSKASGKAPTFGDGSFSINAGSRAFRPGQKVYVDVGWNLTTQPEWMQLRLVWTTTGKGNEEIELASSETFEPKSKRGTHRLLVTLPERPYSFSGQLVSIVWAFELVALPTRESLRVVFVMGPGGREVIADSLKKQWASEAASEETQP